MKVIRVVDHDPSWPAAFDVEKARLTARLGGIVREIHHVGSTAVPGLAAKPKIDIDAVLHPERQLVAAIALLTNDGSHAYHGDPYGDRMWTFTASRVSHGIRLYLCEPGNRTHLERVLFSRLAARPRRGGRRVRGAETPPGERGARGLEGLWRRKVGIRGADRRPGVPGEPAAGTLTPPASTSAR